MSDTNIFKLTRLVRDASGDPETIVDNVWEAGYRQPERSAEEAARITIDTFFYCHSFSIPVEFWPNTYESVLQNELMKAVLGDDDGGPIFDIDPVVVAKNILAAGFALKSSQASLAETSND